jgi:hypothetical protein
MALVIGADMTHGDYSGRAAAARDLPMQSDSDRAV